MGNIDEIHGDQFKNLKYQPKAFNSLISPSEMDVPNGIKTIELRDIDNAPYYWINKEQLYNALDVESVEQITETGKHHEYREKLLPAYVISYKTDEALKAYVSVGDGKFQTVRHRSWRWFDFLWMTHTMDYEGRDNFNTIVLRAFSLLGLITVLSGFLLWYASSPSIRKLLKRKKIKK